MSQIPAPSLTPLELLPHMQAVLTVVKDLPMEQQQAILESAAASARASSELRNRLFMTGSILTNLGKR